MNESFESFSFHPEILAVIEKLGFHTPTKIQLEVIPHVLARQSVIGQSYTGSGKTHAFLLPIFQLLHTEDIEIPVVIVSPTRELARQLFDDVKKIITYAR